MNQNRLYTSIGLFVIFAFGIMLYGGFFLYKNYIKQETETYVMFFKGSIEGLNSQSPITYRGVKIGEVTRIELAENQIDHSVEIPVYVQFYVEEAHTFHTNPIELLIKDRYIADISKPNLITGVSSIKLIQSSKRKILKNKYYKHYPVFPTTVVIEKYTTVDETLRTAQETLKSIQKLVSSKEVRDMLGSIGQSANTFNQLAININHELTPTAAYLNEAMSNLSRAAHSTEEFMDYLNRYPESLLRGRK